MSNEANNFLKGILKKKQGETNKSGTPEPSPDYPTDDFNVDSNDSRDLPLEGECAEEERYVEQEQPGDPGVLDEIEAENAGGVKTRHSLPPHIRKKAIKALLIFAAIGVAFILVNAMAPGLDDLPAQPAASDRAGTDTSIGGASADNDGLPAESIDTSDWQMINEPEPPDFTNYTGKSKQVDLQPLEPLAAEVLPSTKDTALVTKEAQEREDKPEDSLDMSSDEQLIERAAKLRENRDISDRLDVIEGAVSKSAEGIIALNSSITLLSTNVDELSGRVERMAAARAEAEYNSQTQRPPLRLQVIALPRNCPTCVPYAEFTHNGQMLSLANGDTYGAYTVKIVGNRVILSNKDATYSYFAEK